MDKIKIVQIGLGPLGQKITRCLVERKETFAIVGAVDVDPKKTGRDLADICDLKQKSGVRIAASLEEVLRRVRPQVALLTTISDMKRITPQIENIVRHGIHVVTTCEELAFPWKTSPQLAGRIDAAARRHKAAVLATGVNPGFLMDFLPTALTGVCQKVEGIRVARIQNAAFRRVPFQRKIGAGLTPAEFKAKRKQGTLRHVGLTESMGMLADRMGWKLDRTEDVLSPIIAGKKINAGAMTIKRGMAAGVQQIGKGYAKGKLKIELVFRAAVGEPDARDVIEIFGEPNIVSTITGGVNGDIATCAVAVNATRQILRVSPGLHTMTDVPVISFFAG
ncbi:MAG: dihydrodipicolinate reductase [Verrucomicrobia bacterium]|nr:dihydrodipicolinate reductase [Verrucomicrobiota bacterium]MCG2680580.1 dihydrodipicolinate reductase [Kiritimatiellia bacterium]MBU4247520.1 dihydrodipicolinate reductase [Verrucomicrobiota bacterium]MBU4290294.1 dihydrodipicolinate reductase [Verrucomicrobiota bacterium]MBU4429480.1 dihydrodipicolinate reductase [Verrucomicrobiota bacterium]